MGKLSIYCYYFTKDKKIKTEQTIKKCMAEVTAQPTVL